MMPFDFFPGATLPNGTTLLAFTPVPYVGRVIVLAVRATPNAHDPFATWEARIEGDTYSGHYFHRLDEALADFNQRVAAAMPPVRVHRIGRVVPVQSFDGAA